MSTTTPARKGVKYAKNAKNGDWVHTKGNNVTNPAQLKRWFGSKSALKMMSGIVFDNTIFKEFNGKQSSPLRS
jgi:hypothetical protein